MSELPNKRRCIEEQKSTCVTGISLGIKEVVIGKCHTLAFTKSGNVYAWGMGGDGQFGEGTSINRYTPSLFLPPCGGNWKGIAAGEACSYGITQNGCLYSTVSPRQQRQLDSNSKSGFEKIKHPKGEEWKKIISSETEIACFFTETRSVYTVGFNREYFLTQMISDQEWEDFAIGEGFLIGFTASNDVCVFVRGREALRMVPPEGEEWKEIVAGKAHCFGITQTNNVYGWGENGFRQLGLKRDHERYTPEILKPPFGKKWKKIVAGGNHSFGFVQSGEIYVWGENKFGQLGLKERRIKHPTLLKPPDNENWKRIFTGASHSFGITQSGKMYAFGRGKSGQLGLGTSTDFDSPQLLDSPEGEQWGIDIWLFVRILFIARYKEPLSTFFKDRLPLDVFKSICYEILQNNNVSINYGPPPINKSLSIEESAQESGYSTSESDEVEEKDDSGYYSSEVEYF